jgi:outer membrane receptor protein involved in Fe transport
MPRPITCSRRNWYAASLAGQHAGQHECAEQSGDIAGVYLQDLMTITPEWKLMAGLCYDQLRQSRDDLTPKNQDLRH